VPPRDGKTSSELGAWLGTCLGGGVNQLLQPDTIESSIGECS